MKILILYATKYGATSKIAQSILEHLKSISNHNEITICNMNQKIPHLKDFDAVIIGGSIYMNKIRKCITAFLNHHEKELLNKRLGLFISCYTPAGTQGYLEQFFSSRLLEHASAKEILGGIMQYEKMNPIYRFTFKSLKKIDGFNQNFIEPTINYEQIKKFSYDFLA